MYWFTKDLRCSPRWMKVEWKLPGKSQTQRMDRRKVLTQSLWSQPDQRCVQCLGFGNVQKGLATLRKNSFRGVKSLSLHSPTPSVATSQLETVHPSQLTFNTPSTSTKIKVSWRLKMLRPCPGLHYLTFFWVGMKESFNRFWKQALKGSTFIVGLCQKNAPDISCRRIFTNPFPLSLNTPKRKTAEVFTDPAAPQDMLWKNHPQFSHLKQNPKSLLTKCLLKCASNILFGHGYMMYMPIISVRWNPHTFLGSIPVLLGFDGRYLRIFAVQYQS